MFSLLPRKGGEGARRADEGAHKLMTPSPASGRGETLACLLIVVIFKFS